MLDSIRSKAASHWRLILALLIVYVVWGSTFLAIRITVTAMPPFLMAGMRFGIASLILLAIGLFGRQRWPAPREVMGSGFIGLLMLLGANGTLVWAEQFIPSGLAALLQSCLPLLLLVLGTLTRQVRPTRAGGMGAVLGFGGVLLLLWPKLSSGMGTSLFAEGCVLSGMILWAAGMLLGKRVQLPASSLYHSAFSMLAASLGFWTVSVICGEPHRVVWNAVAPGAWIALLYLISFGSCIAFSAFSWLTLHAKPTVVSTYSYVNPVVAVMLGAVVLKEPVDGWLLAGACLVVISVILVLRGNQSEPRLESSATAARLAPEGM